MHERSTDPDVVKRLQAQITELEYERDALKAQLRLEVVHCGEFQLLTAKFDAENLELRDQAGEMAEELTFLRGEAALIERDQARVEVLTAALTDALEGLEDMRPYVSDYFAEKWGHDGYITRARAALAAGPTESEASDA